MIHQGSRQLHIYRGRTTTVGLSIGFDVSNDSFESKIRAEKDDIESDLIATWAISFVTDGTDGELVLTLDNLITAAIEESHGYMDLKRISGGEPLNVFDDPIEVLIKDPITD